MNTPVTLVRYEAARKTLQLANSVDEVKDIRDKAAAMAAYARQAKDTELVEWATELKVRAERRAGEMLQASGIKAGNPQLSCDTTIRMPRLEELGISRDQSSRWQKLAAVPESQFEQAVARAKKIAGEVTTAALLSINRHNHRAQGTGENEWYTPSIYVEAARIALGVIDLDPASTLMAQKTVKAKIFYTAEDDGLSKEWHGRVWLNPPYSQPAIQQFIEKLVFDYKQGNVEQAILLTHNYTDTEWFQIAAKASALICFTRGRIKFIGSDGQIAAPTQGQAFFYYGKARRPFQDCFEPFGVVVRQA